MKLHRAKIIDNNDPDKNGAVKFYIEAIHRVIDDALYPWALPAREGSGGASTFGVSSIPEIDSLVWIFFEDDRNHRNAFYVWDLTLKEMNPHELYESNVKSTVGTTSIYPDVKFIYLKNGICIALSSNADTPEITVFHPAGSSIVIDKTGLINIKGVNGTLEFSLLGETTHQFLSDLIDGILALTVPTGVGPSGVPVNSATFTSLQSQLSTLLSEDVKNS